MEAFLFYIDDWLSSKKVAMMDAVEERGYLRLLLYAAKEPDCGLPDDDNQLAVISLLGHQWGRVTRDALRRTCDPDTRSFRTSGAKLRECFFSKNGRLYNERLLQEWMHQKEVSEARTKAGKVGNSIRWRMKQQVAAFANGIANGSQMGSQMRPVCDEEDLDLDRKSVANGSQTPSQNHPNLQTINLQTKEESQPLCPADAGPGPADAPALIPEVVEARLTDEWLNRQHDEKFWPAWWNHTKKQASRAAFRKCVRCLMRERKIAADEAVAFLCREAVAYRERFEPTESWSWRANLHPATWLNQQMWTDELPPEVQNRSARETLMDRRTSATERALRLAEQQEGM